MNKKPTTAATDVVNVDSAIAAVLSELESISSLKEEQRTTLKVFPDGKDVFALFLTDFGKSLIYQVTLLVTQFVGLIGRSKSVHPFTYATISFKVPALFQMISSGAFG